MDEIALMREIARLQEQINALRTIEIGGVWQDWTPATVDSGGMTLTSITVHKARFSIIGKVLVASLFIQGTIAGTANPYILLTPPVPLTSYGLLGWCRFTIGGSEVSGTGEYGSGNLIFFKPDKSNFTAGQSVYIYSSFSIEIA